jgi:hypothetical protein
MVSKILEFGLLLNDDFALVVAHEQLKMKPKSKPAIFSLETYDDSRCKQDFRFFKTDIYRLKTAMGIPNRMETSNGKKFAGSEGSTGASEKLIKLRFTTEKLDAIKLE